jgi:phosphoribosylaminoimidazolecarboxamide formyltransferase / IMP cyclohydrolase
MAEQVIPVKRALMSVSDKNGLVPLAQILVGKGIEILSTGGTARSLVDGGIPVTSVDSYTGHPEIMDGRVKTLHPRIHGALLGVRDNPSHVEQMRKHGIIPIDLVVVNLYPFQQTVAREGVTIAEAVEQIDIGGPSMVRSAAKNHRFVAVVVDPADYAEVGAEIEKTGGVPEAVRCRLAVKAFGHTARYDSAIVEYLSAAYGVRK